ncbi:MAG: pitrilysin family protein [Candidatus Omnitrophota bacterium]
MMYKRLQARNGLTVITSPMPQMASVSLGIWIGIGGRYESSKKSGISHLVEHMLFKGTLRRSANELKESIEGVGGTFNGFTSDEVTCYMVKVPVKYTEEGIDVLADMVLNAKFDDADLEKERFVVCEEIKMYQDQPADHVLDILSKIMWPGNALGRSLTGSMDTVKAMKREELVKFRDDNYHPANISVVAAGRAVPDKIFELVNQRFGSFAKKKNSGFNVPCVNQSKPRIKVCRGNTNQTHIAMGFHIPEANIQDRFAIKLMNVILGGNMSSRLFDQLREKYGLCYDISSAYKRHSDIGELQIHAGVDNKKAVKSVIAILDELKKLKDIGITEGELTRAKEYTKGQFLLALEQTSTRMLWLGERFMVHKEIPEVKEILGRVDAVNSDEVQKVSGKILKSSSVNLAMISKIIQKDKDKINKELSML